MSNDSKIFSLSVSPAINPLRNQKLFSISHLEYISLNFLLFDVAIHDEIALTSASRFAIHGSRTRRDCWCPYTIAVMYYQAGDSNQVYMIRKILFCDLCDRLPYVRPSLKLSLLEDLLCDSWVNCTAEMIQEFILPPY